MNHDEAESQFAELDEQIRAALQVDTPADQLGRLAQFWRQQSRVDRRRRTIGRVTALAAVLLVALATSWWQWHTPAPGSPRADILAHAGPSQAAPHGAPQQQVAAPRREDKSSISSGRAPTAYEQLLFADRVRQRESMRQSPAVGAVENVIVCVVRDPKTNIQQLLQSAEMKSVHVEPLLLRQLRRCGDARQRAILQLLAACGTSQSTIPLLQLSRRAVLREQALQTLELLVGMDGLAHAAARTDDPSVRAAIYRRLWGNVAAVDVCLSLVQNNALRDETLDAAGDLSQPMLDALLDRLNAEDPNVRLAAALVLGRADGPIVTEALIGLVAENPACHAETWIALTACRGPQTEQFLAFATGQPRLLGSLNRARAYWARITN